MLVITAYTTKTHHRVFESRTEYCQLPKEFQGNYVSPNIFTSVEISLQSKECECSFGSVQENAVAFWCCLGVMGLRSGSLDHC